MKKRTRAWIDEATSDAVKHDINDVMNKEIFNDIKINAIKIWSEYENEDGYASTKIARVRSVKIDEYYIIINMFDHRNQSKLYDMVGESAKKFVKKNCFYGYMK